MIITLPYPNPDLSPNRKNGKHWSSTKSAKDSARDSAFYLTKSELNKPTTTLPATEKFPLVITFVQSDKRRRDLDNLLAASKPSIDGIAKAIGIDDTNFEPITISRAYCKEQSYMTVEI